MFTTLPCLSSCFPVGEGMIAKSRSPAFGALMERVRTCRAGKSRTPSSCRLDFPLPTRRSASCRDNCSMVSVLAALSLRSRSSSACSLRTNFAGVESTLKSSMVHTFLRSNVLAVVRVVQMH